MLNEKIGNWIVEAKLGEGGMGEVYKAQHQFLGNYVAIKTIPNSITLSFEIIDRFVREAKALALVDHPHIIKAIDFLEFKPNKWLLIMQFIEGQDLASILGIKKDSKPNLYSKDVDEIIWTERIINALNWSIQILGGLEIVHEKNRLRSSFGPKELRSQS